MTTMLSKLPDIEVKLQSGQCWCATYTRRPEYQGFGASPYEALGHLLVCYPVLFGFRQVRYANDPATQTFVQSNGLDTVISNNKGFPP